MGTTNRPTIAVVIVAYTMNRWPFVVKAVESVRSQTYAAAEIVLCIDNNEDLFERATAEWSPADAPTVRVMRNRFTFTEGSERRNPRAQPYGVARRYGGGAPRNAAVETVASDIVAFLDDDAWAEPDWLAQLVGVYERFAVVAVGGAPIPDFETDRPAWFPRSFDWVFGCAYEGLPTSTGPLRHLIAANMSVRREAFVALNGFQSGELDDLDLCMRLADEFGTASLYYEPRAVVHHHVPSERVSWRYFYRRCYYVNRDKVQTFRGMGPAANLVAERQFVWRALRSSLRDVRRGLLGEADALRRFGATIAGIALAGAGHLRGRMDPARPWRNSSASGGTSRTAPRPPGWGFGPARPAGAEDVWHAESSSSAQVRLPSEQRSPVRVKAT